MAITFLCFFQIKIDVTNFESKNLNVKICENNEIIVEGKLLDESQEISSYKNFRKSFSFADVTTESEITSKLSADNILTISIQRIVSSYNLVY